MAKRAITKRSEKSDAPRRDIAQEVTDKILAQLEAGAAPWVKPWRAIPGAGMPYNYATGAPYSGTNVMLLWMAQAAADYPTAQWLTFNQAKALGGNVRKGETGTLAVYYGTAQRKDENGEVEGAYRFLKGFTVFNVAQCEGLPEKAAPEGRVAAAAMERDEWADAFLGATLADIRYGEDKAAYYPGKDRIGMPSFESFETSDHFYATGFHELVHWTGAEKRLNRDLKGKFGAENYAAEELVAELGAAFLCAEFGFDGDLRHAGYIQSWIKLLKDDKHAFTRAASAASKAHQYLRGLAYREDAPVDEVTELAQAA